MAMCSLVAIIGCGGSSTTTVIEQAPPVIQTTTTPPTTTRAGTTTTPEGDCGQITFSGTPTTIIVLRGADCSEAVRVATAFGASTPPSPWSCGLAHAPLDRYPLPDGSTG